MYPLTQGTLARLNNAITSIYRTDKVGSVIATCDGTNIVLNKSASLTKGNAPPASNVNNQNTTPELAKVNYTYSKN